jgi:hypothetical protein
MTRLTSIWLLGVALFLAIAIVFGNQLGIPFPLAIRIVAANGCLAIMSAARIMITVGISPRSLLVSSPIGSGINSGQCRPHAGRHCRPAWGA